MNSLGMPSSSATDFHHIHLIVVSLLFGWLLVYLPATGRRSDLNPLTVTTVPRRSITRCALRDRRGISLLAARCGLFPGAQATRASSEIIRGAS